MTKLFAAFKIYLYSAIRSQIFAIHCPVLAFLLCAFTSTIIPSPKAEAQDKPEITPENCQELIQPSGRYLKILTRLEKLNPILARDFSQTLGDTSEQLSYVYLRLKQEVWSYLPNGILPFSNKKPLPEEVRRSLTENFHKQYAIESLNDDKLTLFYANALWGLYITVLQQWSEEIAQEVWTSSEPLSRPLKNFAVSLLTRSLIEIDLQSSSLSPETAAQVFQQKKWLSFPWEKAYKIAEGWLNHSENLEKYNIQTIREWMATHPLHSELDPKVRRMIEDALIFPGLEEVCCKSQPGCAFCPNNLSWLKPNKTE